MVSIAFMNYTRVGVSSAQVFAILATDYGRIKDDQGSLDVEAGLESGFPESADDEVQIEPQPLPLPYPNHPLRNTKFGRLGDSRREKIKRMFSDTMKVAVVNFASNRVCCLVSMDGDCKPSMEEAVTELLKLPLDGKNVTWFQALKSAPLYSRYNVTRVPLCGRNFDVATRVPREGEVWLCLQDTSASLSAIKDLRANLTRAETFLGELRQDPALLSLVWNESASQDPSAVASEEHEHECEHSANGLVVLPPYSASSNVMGSELSSIAPSINRGPGEQAAGREMLPRILAHHHDQRMAIWDTGSSVLSLGFSERSSSLP